MFKEFLFKLDLIAPCVALLSALIFMAVRKRNYTFSDCILVAFLSAELALNSAATVLQYKEINNLWVYDINCLLIHLLFTFYFFRTLLKKRIIFIGLATFFVAFIPIFLTIQPYNSFPSYIYAIASFIIVLYTLTLLNQLIDTMPAGNIFTLKDFWVVAGMLAYFGSSFLIFISYNYLSSISPKKVYVLWQFHNIFLALGCFIFLKAITCNKWLLK